MGWMEGGPSRFVQGWFSAELLKTAGVVKRGVPSLVQKYRGRKFMIRKGSREKKLLKRVQLWPVLFILFAVSIVHAVPTVSNEGLVLGEQLNSHHTVPLLYESVPEGIIESSQTRLAGLGKQILRPPVYNEILTDANTTIKALPPVPAALLMTLTGFFCVSLARDRKVYLSVLAALFWVGQAGIGAIPQLADCIWRHVHTTKHQYDKTQRWSLIADDFRSRPEIEGAQFAALMHYLEGIPDNVCLSVNPKLSNHYFLKIFDKTHSAPVSGSESVVNFAAILAAENKLDAANNSLALNAGWLEIFSPAFIFQNIPRAPPFCS